MSFRVWVLSYVLFIACTSALCGLLTMMVWAIAHDQKGYVLADGYVVGALLAVTTVQGTAVVRHQFPARPVVDIRVSTEEGAP